jgi:carboxymethylenebutenolidase
MADTTIPGGHGDLPVYLATPASTQPWPGVVLIHDAFGMGQDVRNQADWLASEGYLTAAPDLFSWGRPVACVRRAISDLRRRAGRTFEDVETVRVWLTGHPGCTGRVGVIGFCMGGGFALLLAPGFLNDHESAGDHVPFLVKFTGPIMGYGPNAAAAQDARRRITEFFATHLR